MKLSCEAIREAYSARLDGEEQTISDALIDAHLATCASCRHYIGDLEALSRRLRLQMLQPVPDLVNAILSPSVGPEPLPSVRTSFSGRPARWLRLDWGQATRWVAAVVPLAVAVPALALGAFTHPQVIPSHLPTPCTFFLLHHVL
ncbi:MAG TPA: zf-HC2 domain-containing protein [Acidimicrobiales bacterium]